MELRHIRYLIAAAEEEHFGRAADRLNVTRSAVSQIIADLEGELGVELFERQAQRVRLTAAGRAMLPRLNALMTELNQTIALGKRVGQGKSGLLRIGYGSLSTHHPIFRDAIKRFHEACPDIVLSLVEVPTSRQLRALRDGVIQAGFMHVGPGFVVSDRRQHGSGDVEAQDLHGYVIEAASLGVMVPRDHRLAGKEGAQLEWLANEPLVMVYDSENSPAFGHLFRLCRSAGFELQIVQEVSATTTQQDLVAVGVGIGVTVVGGRHAYPAELCVVRFTDIDYPISFQVGWMGRTIEPALREFLQVVRSVNEMSSSARRIRPEDRN